MTNFCRDIDNTVAVIMQVLVLLKKTQKLFFEVEAKCAAYMKY